MQTVPPRPDALDPRPFFRSYALLAAAMGVTLLSWGPRWLGTDLPELPFHKAALIRLFGAILVAHASYAASLAAIDEPLSRHRATRWFLLSHLVVLLILVIQREAIWGRGVADYAILLVVVCLGVFTYLWGTSAGEVREASHVIQTIFTRAGRDSAAELLRSEYEQRIREAGSLEERHRLARDLHDSVKQQLFAIHTAAATVQARLDSDPGGARTALEQVRGSARDAMKEMEALLDQLRAAPVEPAGLVAAIRQQAEAVGLRTGARIDFRIGALPPALALAPGAAQHLFRSAQEALSNAARHARARNITVALEAAPSWLTLTVRDDGQGFDPERAARGMGLANLNNRAEEAGGKCEIASRPGNGTTVSLSLPLYQRPAAEYKRQAIIWAVMILVWLIILFVNRGDADLWASPSLAWMAVAVIGLTRQVIAWRRVRQQRGADS